MWTHDDCIQFVLRSMKSFKAPESVDTMQEVIASFRKNLVTGSALLMLSDEEWKEIIFPAGLSRHPRAITENNKTRRESRFHSIKPKRTSKEGDSRKGSVSSTRKDYFILSVKGSV